MINIRLLREADIDAADRLLQLSFQRPANRRIELERALRIQPDGWHLAEIGGVPVGMVGAIIYERFSWIGLMAVDPGHQSRGIGRSLMKHILADLDRRGSPMVLLDASDAGFPLYQSLGFVEEDECRIYEFPSAQLAEENVESDAYSLLHTMSEDLLPAVIAFDEPIFGTNRDAVLRAYFSNFPGRSFVALDAKTRVAGYLIAQARRIGPWAAASPEIAANLLHRALLLDFPEPPQVIVAGKNPASASMLRSRGFEARHANRHMRRGGTRLPGSRERMFGQASFAIG